MGAFIEVDEGGKGLGLVVLLSSRYDWIPSANLAYIISILQIGCLCYLLLGKHSLTSPFNMTIAD